MQAYLYLESIFRETKLLQNIKSMLSWDTRVMLPKNSVEARSEQNAYLSKLIREKIYNPLTKEKIEEANSLKHTLNEWQQANLKKMEEIYAEYNIIDNSLLQETAKASAICEMTWREAKKHNDYKRVEPAFSKLISLKREIANCKAKYFNLKPYETLLDSYDEGRKIYQLDHIFSELKATLPNIIAQVRSKQKVKPSLEGEFPTQKQMEFAKHIMSILGFDFSHGRIDISPTAFRGGTQQDIRLGVAFNEQNLFSGLYSIIHETGHAMYNSNLPKSYAYQPVGASLNTSIHESQAILYQRQIGGSLEFLNFLHPHLISHFNLNSREFSLENIRSYIRHVEPSFIRTRSDEVTYQLHIILRYELEKRLIIGELEVKDLSHAWNEGFKELFGLTPPNDTEGCLQDIHWYKGKFGYFPCYTIGSIIAAQLMNSIKVSLPNLGSDIKEGNFKPLQEWLKDNIHSKGSLFTAEETLKQATGEQMNASYFISYLKNNYL
jgi:carboxypeptidase Taq